MTSFRPISTLAAFALLSVCLSAPHNAVAQPTRADAEKDPVLRAMLAELDRSKAQLQLPGFEKPFFIQYRIEDIESFQTTAEFGASESSARAHQRVARVIVRVGDYKTDSSAPRGDGSLQVAALDDDPVALRSALWWATDTAYKSALAAYAQKQAELKQVQTPPQADDFSREAPIVSLTDPLHLQLDEPAWTARVARDSGLYRADPAAAPLDLQYSSGEFQARATTIWIVNSEGAIVRKSALKFSEAFGVGTQAADGMRLDRSYASSGISLADLDSPAQFQQHVTSLIASLADLRKAPLVDEEYHGPVLFSADASADALRALLAGGLIATRPKLGTEARTNGPFASSLHARVLPEFFDVVDTPGLKSFAGKGLLGAYSVDDEAVPAQPVQLITDGKLENYLIGREPVRDFPHSNGHARAGATSPSHPSIGVLQITAKQGLSVDELTKKLIALGHDRDLKSVYLVATLGSRLTPRLLYRVTPDGKQELVRGAALDDLDQRALRSGIVAAGQDLFLANYPDEIPLSVLAPALLFEDVTIRRANEQNDKLPFYPPPQ